MDSAHLTTHNNRDKAQHADLGDWIPSSSASPDNNDTTLIYGESVYKYLPGIYLFH